MKKKTKCYFRSIVLFVLCSGALLAGFEIGKELLTRQQAKAEYDSTVEKHIAQNNDVSKEPLSEKPSWVPDIEIDHNGLCFENSDYIGWIYYEDGNVSYPVCQSTEEDPAFYLTHTFLKESNPSGCIFIDYDKDERFESRINYIYGHNMAAGTMFGSLKKIYNEPDTKLQNPYFYLFLKDGYVKRYRVFSVYVTDKADEVAFNAVNTNKEEIEYIQNSLKKGSVETHAPFDESEEKKISSGEYPLVILTTCYGRAGTSKRLLIAGIEIDKAQFY